MPSIIAVHRNNVIEENNLCRINHLPLPGKRCDDSEDSIATAALTGANGRVHEGKSATTYGRSENLDPEAPANYSYGRRRSRAVLYQLSGHYKTEKTKKIHSKLSTNVSIIQRNLYLFGLRMMLSI